MIVLPVAAICVATVINRELPSTLTAAIAITGSVIAGAATVNHSSGHIGNGRTCTSAILKIREITATFPLCKIHSV